MPRVTLAVLLAFASVQFLSAADNFGLRVPEGFEVTRFADDDLAHDIYSMTVNSRGEVVVSSAGYIKRLLDDDKDGKADRAVLFSNLPKSGAHGMLFDGDDLICSGDAGLLRFRDANGDGVADGPPETIAELKISEHGINGITRGPDGWFYVACGNDAGVTAKLAATPYSPVKTPNQGAIVRFSPDLKKSEIYAHGFRNPYDLAFGPGGRLFTVDSDGERDQHLPWYSPTRLFDVQQGQHHGWLVVGWQRSWNKPAYFFDSVPRVVEIGRGSPTGVLAYQHNQFPVRYRDGIFSACWTLGKVYFFPLTPKGSSYTGTKENFLETVGDVGFAPVDLEVAPDGSLLVAIGGRGTRGSVFRVKYIGKKEEPRRDLEPPAISHSAECDKVLKAPQPLSAWSRAQWLPIAKTLQPEDLVHATSSGNFVDRYRAFEVLVDVCGGLDSGAIKFFAENFNRWEKYPSHFRARLVWAASANLDKKRALNLLAAGAKSPDPVVARAAWESLHVLDAKQLEELDAPWYDGITSSDRGVRAACLAADSRTPPSSQNSASPQNPRVVLGNLWRRAKWRKLTGEDFSALVTRFAASDDREFQLEAIRLMQLAVGDVKLEPSVPDVYTGYAPAAKELPDVRADLSKLAAYGPAKDTDVNRELARLFSMLASQMPPPEALFQAAAFQSESKVEEDIHYLIVASRWAGKWKDSTPFAKALANLHRKMRAGPYYPSRNWPTRLGEVVEQFAKAEPQFAAAVVADPEFRWPAQAFLALKFPEKERQAAARKLLAAASKADRDDEDYRWPVEMVELVGQLPAEESLPALRLAWNDYGLREKIVPVLFRTGVATEDRTRWREALESNSPEIIVRLAAAREQLDEPLESLNATAAIAALRRQCAFPNNVDARQALIRLLRRHTGQPIVIQETPANSTPLPTLYQEWFAWHAKTYPNEAKKLFASAGLDAAGWQDRVTAIKALTGDVPRGKVAFERRSCAKCHAGASRFGPDLAGAAGRFAPADLLAAIVDPSKEVAPTYQTTQVETAAGKIYVGLVVYESPESTILATGPDSSLRVAGEEILAMRPSKQSLMPVGLLNGVEDQEIADLLAYLATLKAGK